METFIINFNLPLNMSLENDYKRAKLESWFRGQFLYRLDIEDAKPFVWRLFYVEEWRVGSRMIYDRDTHMRT